MAKNKDRKPHLNKAAVDAKYIPESGYYDKKPRTTVDVSSYLKQSPKWGFKHLDRDGAFGWKTIGKENWENRVLPTLCDFERMTWSQIEQAAGGRSAGTNHHSLAVPDDITKEAIDRLIELKLENVPQLYSLRLTNLIRIIGIRDNDTFNLLWYDPEHKIAKTTPR